MPIKRSWTWKPAAYRAAAARADLTWEELCYRLQQRGVNASMSTVLRWARDDSLGPTEAWKIHQLARVLSLDSAEKLARGVGRGAGARKR